MMQLIKLNKRSEEQNLFQGRERDPFFHLLFGMNECVPHALQTRTELRQEFDILNADDVTSENYSLNGGLQCLNQHYNEPNYNTTNLKTKQIKS